MAKQCGQQRSVGEVGPGLVMQWQNEAWRGRASARLGAANQSNGTAENSACSKGKAKMDWDEVKFQCLVCEKEISWRKVHGKAALKAGCVLVCSVSCGEKLRFKHLFKRREEIDEP